jgi:hypothetical protein
VTNAGYDSVYDTARQGGCQHRLALRCKLPIFVHCIYGLPTSPQTNGEGSENMLGAAEVSEMTAQTTTI